ncbi:MAG: DUF2029 domain-containing protein [candidate division Zixibacteria bacterium]|nr:DUF2029 domain-containing protein [candidate division Zixibacteria bacterium]
MKFTRTDFVKYLVILFSGISVALFFWQSIRNFHYPNGNDLQSYINASKLFFNGENPFTGTLRRYIYPLFLAVAIYPLTLFKTVYVQKTITAGLWSLLSYFAFFSTVFGCWNLIYDKRPFWYWFRQNLFPLALIIILIHPFMQMEFINGQVNLITVALMAGFYFMLQKNQRFPAALLLAAAASIKIAPGLCLILLLMTRQYRVFVYFFVLLLLFVFGLPYLINTQSIEYYRYFLNEVVPIITGNDIHNGFENFSIISTLSYLFDVHWHPLAKISAICMLAVGLTVPIIVIARKFYEGSNGFYRQTCLAAVISTLPLTFPMSESHHLLTLLIPIITIVAYWQKVLISGVGFLKDRLSFWFIICLAVLHTGQGLTPTPLRFFALVGIYIGLLILLKSKNNTFVAKI